MADAVDSKSTDLNGHEGSTPSFGTRSQIPITKKLSSTSSRAAGKSFKVRTLPVDRRRRLPRTNRRFQTGGASRPPTTNEVESPAQPVGAAKKRRAKHDGRRKDPAPRRAWGNHETDWTTHLHKIMHPFDSAGEIRAMSQHKSYTIDKVGWHTKTPGNWP